MTIIPLCFKRHCIFRIFNFTLQKSSSNLNKFGVVQRIRFYSYYNECHIAHTFNKKVLQSYVLFVFTALLLSLSPTYFGINSIG